LCLVKKVSGKLVKKPYPIPKTGHLSDETVIFIEEKADDVKI
jgi:hypothetical protein